MIVDIVVTQHCSLFPIKCGFSPELCHSHGKSDASVPWFHVNCVKKLTNDYLTIIQTITRLLLVCGLCSVLITGTSAAISCTVKVSLDGSSCCVLTDEFFLEHLAAVNNSCIDGL